MGGAPLTSRPDPMPTIAPGAPEAPVLPYTDDGVAAALELAGRDVRWNDTTRALEVFDGESWIYGDQPAMDDLTVAVSKFARGQRGSKIEPFVVPGARNERRLYGAVGRRPDKRYTGPGDDVYQAVTSWCGAHREGRLEGRLSLTAVMRAADVLLGWETGPRASGQAKRSAKDALIAAGWKWVKARPLQGGSARMLWCSPVYDPDAR